MNALVTSGGTKVWLDSVRYVGNVSKGGFGARIVNSLILDLAHIHVFHLVAKGAEQPAANVTASGSYHKFEYETFWEYHDAVEALMKNYTFDVAFFAAAVSDYGYSRKDSLFDKHTKIPSDENSFTITLSRLPKVITQAKKWAREAGNHEFKQIGFKLTAGKTAEEMVEIARESGLHCHSDLTIVNDIATIKKKEHQVMLVPTVPLIDTTSYPVSTQSETSNMVTRALEYVHCIL